MRPEKKQLVDDIRELVEASVGLFLVSYQGLTVAAFTELRAALADVSGECHVVPNRLFRAAAIAGGLAEFESVEVNGGTALVTCHEDVVSVAKVLRDMRKKHEKMTVKLAALDGKLIGAEDAVKLADLPSMDVLRAQLLGLLNAPAGQLVGVLNAKVASVVYVLSAYLREKEQAA